MAEQKKSFLEQLEQCQAPTWDGDLISKSMRDHLCKHGLIERFDGWNFISKEGVRVLVALGALRP